MSAHATTEHQSNTSRERTTENYQLLLQAYVASLATSLGNMYSHLDLSAVEVPVGMASPEESAVLANGVPQPNVDVAVTAVNPLASIYAAIEEAHSGAGSDA